MKSFLYIFTVSILLNNAALANSPKEEPEPDILDPGNDPHFNYIFGISPFLGLLGIEFQKENHAFGLGAPGHLSYRYFFKPYKDSKFFGVYLGSYSTDKADDTVDGVFYKEKESEFFGIGLGKRWQWPSGWNFTLSVAIEVYDDTFSNPGSTTTGKEDGYFLFPGINGGYKF